MSAKKSPGWKLEDGGFVALVALVTLAFAWLLLPYFGAILWGLVAAIVFAPLTGRLAKRLGGRHGLAATLTLLLILALVIVPAILLGASLVQEAAGLYSQLQSGQIDIAQILARLRASLPPSLEQSLGNAGFMDQDRLRELIGSGLASGLRSVASRTLTVGQGALTALAALGVMLYLTWFLLRDGEVLGGTVKQALPLEPGLRDRLIEKFLTVVRAIMKGTVLVAVIQGLVGGTIFWALGIEGALLWGLLMGFFSLIPAVGTGLIWVPVALYLLVTGSVSEGVILVFCGLFVIGMIDNLLRPILVGKDTKLPDFVVLIATVAGLELFGISGFVVGPIIAALFIAVWQIVTEMRGLGTHLNFFTIPYPNKELSHGIVPLDPTHPQCLRRRRHRFRNQGAGTPVPRNRARSRRKRGGRSRRDGVEGRAGRHVDRVRRRARRRRRLHGQAARRGQAAGDRRKPVHHGVHP